MSGGGGQAAETDAAEVIAQHQRLHGGPCVCGRWPDRHCRDGQGWHEHVAEALVDAGLLTSSPGVTP